MSGYFTTIVFATTPRSGNGGSSSGSPVGGGSANSEGGGIFDGFDGTLELLGCDINDNAVNDGFGGDGGTTGPNSHGRGGGIFIAKEATALANANTDFVNNVADKG